MGPLVGVVLGELSGVSWSSRTCLMVVLECDNVSDFSSL